MEEGQKARFAVTLMGMLGVCVAAIDRKQPLDSRSLAILAQSTVIDPSCIMFKLHPILHCPPSVCTFDISSPRPSVLTILGAMANYQVALKLPTPIFNSPECLQAQRRPSFDLLKALWWDTGLKRFLFPHRFILKFTIPTWRIY